MKSAFGRAIVRFRSVGRRAGSARHDEILLICQGRRPVWVRHHNDDAMRCCAEADRGGSCDAMRSTGRRRVALTLARKVIEKKKLKPNSGDKLCVLAQARHSELASMVTVASVATHTLCPFEPLNGAHTHCMCVALSCVCVCVLQDVVVVVSVRRAPLCGNWKFN